MGQVKDITGKKWHRFDKDNIPYCYNIDYGYGWKDDDFCSRAERREVSE